jgi:hypoxanthine phosphoribosyltransferase
VTTSREIAVGEVLFSAEAIAARIGELGAQLSVDYKNRTPLFIGVLHACAPFLADLTRAITIPAEFDLIGVTKFSDAEGIRLEKDTAISIEGRHVVLVDDTIDTGMTLNYLIRTLRARLPASLAICTLLDRPHRRTADIEINYHGFEVADVFVVGYGLDDRGHFRELPALHAHGSWPQ